MRHNLLLYVFHPSFLVLPHINLFLNFDIPSLKIKFDELDILSISNWTFASYTGSKNQVWNRQNIKFVKLDFSN